MRACKIFPLRAAPIARPVNNEIIPAVRIRYRQQRCVSRPLCAGDASLGRSRIDLLPVADANSGDDSITYRARAIGAARSGNLSCRPAPISNTSTPFTRLFSIGRRKSSAEAVEQGRNEAAAWLDHAEGRNDAAIAWLCARLPKSRNRRETSPTAGIPAREMLADMLLEMKRPEQAPAEYKTSLKFFPESLQ